MKRRDFLRSVAAAGGAVLGGSLLSACMGEPPGASTADGQETDGGSAGGSVDGLPPDRSASDRSSDLSSAATPDGSPATPYLKPNILVILVDQMRYPAWPSQFSSAKYVPHITSLRAGGVSFSQHYVATSPCSPSRASLLTGLYPHQHNLLTNVGKGTPSLDPRFPTYGTLLRDHFGYRTAWFGKWHLSPVNANCTAEIAKPYGFGHFGCRPEDTEAIGVDCDPGAAGQFANWIAQQKGNPKPFCATVSLINPHDICYFGTATLDGNTHPPVAGATEKNPPSVFPASTVPQNHETSFSSKPRLQQRIATNGVPLPAADCARFLDLYLLLHQYLDYQVGRVLDALEQAGFGSNTIVLFTSDHGEYGGAHGLKGKGRVAYQEGIRIPFYVRDPTGQWIPNQSKGSERAQLSSQVDVTPLLLTLASGGNGWRQKPACQHLARRADLAAVLRNPAANGRPYILHTVDHQGPAAMKDSQGAIIPAHVIALLRHQPGDAYPRAKLVTYNVWDEHGRILRTNEERELYDHTTTQGARELQNLATAASPPTAAIKSFYDLLFQEAIPNELREKLPGALAAASSTALQRYLALP